MAALRPLCRLVAALVYSTTLGYLVVGLWWYTFAGSLPPMAVVAVGGILAIRVTTLFASMTAAARLNWKAIWIGGVVGLVALAGWSAWSVGRDANPPRTLLAPLFLSSLVVVATAGTLRSPTTAHVYHSSGFARALHFVQVLILFFAALPASFFWNWTRPYVVVVTLSAFVLWQLWGGACPVTLTENAARVREGRPLMPPEDGFVPDVLARLGIAVSGNAVTVLLYGLGFSLCGWFALDWTL
jgi:hypothetical protein